jgi:hypothetical protein
VAAAAADRRRRPAPPSGRHGTSGSCFLSNYTHTHESVSSAGRARWPKESDTRGGKLLMQIVLRRQPSNCRLCFDDAGSHRRGHLFVVAPLHCLPVLAVVVRLASLVVRRKRLAQNMWNCAHCFIWSACQPAAAAINHRHKAGNHEKPDLAPRAESREPTAIRGSVKADLRHRWPPVGIISLNDCDRLAATSAHDSEDCVSSRSTAEISF